MAAEGLDIKSLTTAVFVTPKTDITQASGRILRVKHAQPMIIDIIDGHTVFAKQWEKRKKFYFKNNYKIMHTNSDLYGSDKWEQIEKKTRKKTTPKCLLTLNNIS